MGGDHHSDNFKTAMRIKDDLLHKHLLSAYHVSGTVLGTGKTAVTNRDEITTSVVLITYHKRQKQD